MKRKDFLKKAVSAATAAAIALSPLAFSFTANAATLTGLQDQMNRTQAGLTAGVEHLFVFTATTNVSGGAGANVVTVSFPDSDNWCSASGDLTATGQATDLLGNALTALPGTLTATCTVGATDVITISGVNDLTATTTYGVLVTGDVATLGTSAAASTPQLTLTTNDGSADVDTGSIELAILDDDTVNVEGYIDTILTFDIDTTTEALNSGAGDCSSDGTATDCDGHSAPAVGGIFEEAGYVVSLGSMLTSNLSRSGDVSVDHADGAQGTINLVYFDLTTNADGGAVVTVKGLNDGLEMDASNIIDSVVDGTDIAAGDGVYGLQIADADITTVAGAIAQDANCDADLSVYMGPNAAAAEEIFNTAGAPVDTARVGARIAASPDALDGAGTYSDQLTFIATATF